MAHVNSSGRIVPCHFYGTILYKALFLKRTVLFWRKEQFYFGKSTILFPIFRKELFLFCVELFFFSMELFFFQCFCMELLFFRIIKTELFFLEIVKIELFFFGIVKIELFFWGSSIIYNANAPRASALDSVCW